MVLPWSFWLRVSFPWRLVFTGRRDEKVGFAMRPCLRSLLSNTRFLTASSPATSQRLRIVLRVNWRGDCIRCWARISRSHPTWLEGDAFLLGTPAEIRRMLPSWKPESPIAAEGFSLSQLAEQGHNYWVLAGGTDRGVLYGVFRMLEQVAQQKFIAPDAEAPSSPIRWVNQWDNFDGSIERGYGGRSIFFDNGHVRADLSRVSEYGRLLASVGINGAAVNNVNANLHTLDPGDDP